MMIFSVLQSPIVALRLRLAKGSCETIFLAEFHAAKKPTFWPTAGDKLAVPPIIEIAADSLPVGMPNVCIEQIAADLVTAI